MKKQLLAIALTGAFAASTAHAQAPHEQSDNSWISISGQVSNPTEDGFTLNYGEGEIAVDMSDAPWYDMKGPFSEGARVSVYGEIDRDESSQTSIEANSVFVESVGRLFSPTETVYGPPEIIPVVPVRVGDFTYTGRVETVGDDAFTIDTGRRQLTIDVSEMANNPLDNEGALQLKQGDTVMVYGVLDAKLGASRTVTADSIITVDNRARGDS